MAGRARVSWIREMALSVGIALGITLVYDKRSMFACSAFLLVVR